MLVSFAFLVGKWRNMPIKYGATIRTTKICLISVLAIFSVSRRKIIKISEQILRNHESNGHFLDTIKSPFFPLCKSGFSPFYSDHFTCVGHYNLSNISYHILYFLCGPLRYTLTKKPNSGYVF